MRRGTMAALTALMLAFALAAAAQTKPEDKQAAAQAGALSITFEHKDGQVAIARTIDQFNAQAATYTFVASEVGFDSKVVKGAPFSADTVTEFSQTLASGQKIYRKSSSSLYRDAEGRTRREQTISSIGPFAPSGPEKKMIYINDPVAQVRYTLDPEKQTATVYKTGAFAVAGGRGGGGGAGGRGVAGAGVSGGAISWETGNVVATPFGTAMIRAKEGEPSNVKTETLGMQLIEGIQAEGTRTTSVIPTGNIGNDSPIESFSERWYSPELQVVVKTVRSDPMSGDNAYRLTNIRRGDPSPDMFQVPAGYTIQEPKVVVEPIAVPRKPPL